MEQYKKIKDLKQGDFFQIKEGAIEVFMRGCYDHEFKGFRCDYTSDISRDRILKGDRLVFIGMDY
tara:strand:+ start:408 stop:602 length:195 start_codon:yes stop_codon:yes gene_type:complete